MRRFIATLDGLVLGTLSSYGYLRLMMIGSEASPEPTGLVVTMSVLIGISTFISVYSSWMRR